MEDTVNGATRWCYCEGRMSFNQLLDLRPQVSRKYKALEEQGVILWDVFKYGFLLHFNTQSRSLTVRLRKYFKNDGDFCKNSFYLWKDQTLNKIHRESDFH